MQNFIVNIDSTKKYFVNSVNQRMISNKCVIDCAETEQFKFSFVDKCGVPVELQENMQYYLAVSKERNNAGTILIFDDNPVIDGNSIIFNLNSKTEEYLSIIKNKTECWIEIGEKQLGADNYSILLQDNCICLPKVYVIGVPTELESYYTKTESDALFATKEQLNNDYYTKAETNTKLSEKADLSSLVDYQPISGMNEYALKTDIPTKTSELENDSNFVTSSDVEESLSAYQPISGMNVYALKDDIPTKTSELTNDSGFITSGEVDLSDYYTKEETNTKLSEKADLSSLVDYQPISGMNVYALKDEIPTKVSELENDSGFISSYTETDPIFTSVSGTLATKDELPTKVSELINDSGFITSGEVDFSDYYTKEETNTKLSEKADLSSLVDYQPISGMNIYALNADIPTKTSELENDNGFISSYTETDPIFSSVSGTLATKTYVDEAIPNISDMINVEGNNLNVGGVLNEDNTPKFSEVDIRGVLVKVLGSGMKVYDTVTGNEILSTTSNDFKYKTEYDVERMKKASTANFNFEPYTYLTLTSSITSINYNLPEGTLKNAILQFTTGDSIEFTIIGSSSYKINKPFAFEPNTSYIIYVDDYDIFWCKLHNFNQ